MKFHDSSNDGGNRNSQLLIQNLVHDTASSIAVDSNNNVKLPVTGKIDTWAWGNITPGQYETGTNFTTSRSDVLLSNGKHFTRSQPTYAEYASDQMVNVKAVDGHPVKGDGSTDDLASLNAILADNAANCKIIYFPYGVYIVKDTLKIPLARVLQVKLGQSSPDEPWRRRLLEHNGDSRALPRLASRTTAITRTLHNVWRHS